MTALYNDNDRHACAWLHELVQAGHIEPGVVDGRSIHDIRPEELAGYEQVHLFAGIGVWSLALRLAGWPAGREVWTASCPCQPFSLAGRRKGTGDHRHLWPEAFRLVRERRPQCLVGEQVASKDGLAWVDSVFADLEGAGYACGAVDTCAAGFGAPHIRSRLYWCAVRMADPEGREQQGGTESDDGHGLMEEAGVCDITVGRLRGAERVADAICVRPERRPIGGGEPSEAGQAQGEARERERGGADDRRSGSTGGLADAAGRQLPQPLGGPQGRDGHGPDRQDGRPGPTNGLWRDADWVFCRDSKWRPVAPGSSPLAPAGTVRNRVALLRGAGNSLNIAQAAEFVAAVIAVT